MYKLSVTSLIERVRYRAEFCLRAGDSPTAHLIRALCDTIESQDDERFSTETWRWLDRLGT
jgi:hypothetical protein